MFGSKYFIPAVGGIAMTIGLTQAMIKLIHVEFEAQQKLETIVFEVEEIKPIENRTHKTQKPERQVEVEIPPRIDRITNTSVDAPPVEPEPEPAKKVEFPTDGFDLDPIDTAGIDKTAQPILRSVAIVPRKALEEGRSGHCIMRFNVDSLGRPFDVKAHSCSHPMFEANSIKATKKFKYLAKYKNGVPVNMNGVETKITYQVLDENGKLLPES